MAPQQWGQVVATGDSDFLLLVRESLDEATRGVPLPKPIEEMPTKVFQIIQRTPAEMISLGLIIPGTESPKYPTGMAAHGYTKGNILSINSRIVRQKPYEAKHVVRHEIGHVVMRKLSANDETDLLGLMYRQDGSHPKRWIAGVYERQPSECAADTWAEGISGLDSPWDDFAYYLVDVNTPDIPTLVDIIAKAAAPIPTPQPAPEPIPTPDPIIVALTAEREAWKARALADEIDLLAIDSYASKYAVPKP